MRKKHSATGRLIIFVIIWIGYLAAFTCYRIKDFSPVREGSWYGASCYDKIMTTGDMDWERIYARKLYYYRAYLHNGDKIDYESLKEEAKDEAKKNLDSFNREVSSIRKYSFKKEFSDHAVCSGIALIVLYIIFSLRAVYCAK